MRECVIPEILPAKESLEAWPRRRAEILELFAQNVYGRTPELSFDEVKHCVLESLPLEGGTQRETHCLYFQKQGKTVSLRYTMYDTPQRGQERWPCAVMIEPFDKNIQIQQSPRRRYEHLPYDLLLEHHLIPVFAHVDDLCPDEAPDFDARGLLRLFPRQGADAWGAVGIWAWAASRVIDCLTEDARVDAGHIAVAGCSRAGKTALWCAAQDPRVALVISNVSGCTGAAMTRGKRGEQIADITSVFPHWFCRNYRDFAGQEDRLPVDQHMLLALAAPRPLYVSSASEDDWADPEKEFESCLRVSELYERMGKTGLAGAAFPPVNTPLARGNVAYHLRQGAHGCHLYDWQQFVPFICRKFGIEKKEQQE